MCIMCLHNVQCTFKFGVADQPSNTTDEDKYGFLTMMLNKIDLRKTFDFLKYLIYFAIKIYQLI